MVQLQLYAFLESWIIQLPDNLFFGTSIATWIIVLKKSKVDNHTLFIDASKEFKKVTNNNRLTDGSEKKEENNIKNIWSWYEQRKAVEYKVYLAKKSEIEQNDYNLSVSTYVEQKDNQEVIDIKALNEEIKQIVEKENILRQKIDEIILEIERA